MIEILQNTQRILDIVFSAGYADGTVTVTVKDADNTTVSTGSATIDNSTAGRYMYTLAPQSAPMWLVVTWSGAWGGVTQSISTGAGQNDGEAAEVQIVGNVLFTIAQLRALPGGPSLTNFSTYPDETLIDVRSRVTAMFEDYCDVAFVPRYGRYVADGTWDADLWLPNTKINSIRAVTVDGVALGSTDLAQVTFSPDGKVYRNSYWGFWSGLNPQNIVFSYEHGYRSVPDDVARAAMIEARYELTATTLADRTLGVVGEFGLVRQAQPGMDCPTGIPIVDETLNRYKETVSVF